MDIAGFGDARRDDAGRLRMHDAMYEVVSDAFEAAGVPWSEVVYEDRGDGMLVIVPTRIPVLARIEPLLARLYEGLRAYNRRVDEDIRVRLRTALHTGFVYEAPGGLAGIGINRAFQLLDVEPLKKSQDATGAELAFIASDAVYGEVVRHRQGGIDPETFHPVDVAEEETRTRAWIHLPGRGPARAWAPLAGTAPASRPGSGLVFYGETHIGGDPIAGDKPTRSERRDRLGADHRPDRDVAVIDDEGNPRYLLDRDEKSTPQSSGPSPARFLSAHLPARVPRRAEVSLVVRIQVGDHGDTGVRTVALRQMPLDGAEVTIVVQAPHGLVPLDALQQVIHVPSEGDSDPVRFPFRADDVGLQQTRVQAWAGGTFLAELQVEVSVEEHGPYADTPARRTPLPSTEPNAGEVTLQVRLESGHYVFQLLSDMHLFKPVDAESLAIEPTAAVERTVALLRQFAKGTAPYAGANAYRRLVEAGVGLWNDMVPGKIQDQFWALSEHVSAFSIADDRGIIPWELLYPRGEGRDDEGFLVERFPVLRRVYEQKRHDSIMLGTPHFIAPAGGPANARDEIAALRALFTDDGDEVIGDLAGLLALIDSGPADALHFACHNAHDPDGGPSIGMDGGPFVPDLLNTAATVKSLEADHPLVFMNACRTAGAAMQYLRPTGWAQKFMTAGAGTFVGTLWAVRSGTATRFAEPFYQALQDGEPLGEASRIARTAARGDDGDPSWLAYTVYGNPTARARA